jgi:hypothetical protein
MSRFNPAYHERYVEALTAVIALSAAPATRADGGGGGQFGEPVVVTRGRDETLLTFPSADDAHAFYARVQHADLQPIVSRRGALRVAVLHYEAFEYRQVMRLLRDVATSGDVVVAPTEIAAPPPHPHADARSAQPSRDEPAKHARGSADVDTTVLVDDDDDDDYEGAPSPLLATPPLWTEGIDDPERWTWDIDGPEIALVQRH